ncbi:MAG: cupin [Austwickia sp.]|nr:cupin [Austwickia sp.]MBK8436766.1 cupin [Austwickia sp.]MBK9100395.1 cupin [Austwickia sp.]
MPELIQQPFRIEAPGGKTIDEHVGLASTGHDVVSVARMAAPAGWSEPAQRPEFDEVTVVLSGLLLVDHDGGQARVRGGQAIITRQGERVRYTAGPEGADYLAICLPAFSEERAHREA